MAKYKKNIAGLVREIIINNNHTSKIVNELYIQLLRMIIDYLISRGIRKDYKNTAEDIRGEVIDKLLKSVENQFWKENLDNTEENDKKINAYIYTMIKESYAIVKDNFADAESNLLYKATGEICKELVKEGFLKLTDRDYYALSNIKKCEEYNKASYRKYCENLRRGKNKEQLDHKKLKEFIKFIFAELENNCFKVSVLTRVVSNNSNFGNLIEERVSRSEVESTSLSEYDENLTILVSKEDEDSPINDRIIEKWINKFKNNYGEDERLENAIILLLFWNNITLVKTAEYLSNKEIAGIKKSTVKNRIDSIIMDIGFFKEEIEDEDRKKYMQIFIETLGNEFIPEKYIEDMKKMKMEGIKR